MGSRRGFIKKMFAGGGLAVAGAHFLYSRESLEATLESSKRVRTCSFNMCNYCAPKIDRPRIAFVGIGARGTGLLKNLVKIPDIEISAICDTRQVALDAAQELLQKSGRPKAQEFTGDESCWKKMCELEGVDVVFNATPWKWHAPISVYAMECGKHAAVEIPAAITLEDCWKLVETSERKKRHCVQLENCCYDFFEASTIQMAQKGIFGRVVSAEAAYIHGILHSFAGRVSNGKQPWRWNEMLAGNGNLYPTHGLGPVAFALGVNRGDKLDKIVSMSSDDFSMSEFSEKNSEKHPDFKTSKGAKFCGNMNASLIRTKLGRLINLQHDVSTERPYDRKHIISGTKAFVQKYPLPGKIAFGKDFLKDAECKKILDENAPELIRHVGEFAKKAGGHGGMDYVMLWRLIDCLRNGLPMDMDVYDAAEWSSIYPLSIWSVANSSSSISVPDFTGGAWQTNAPVDLSLRNAGTTSFGG